MNLRFIDWIWHVRGSLALAPEQSSKDVFDRLDPLFQQTGTSHERNANTLTFHKRDQAAQDKMSIFDDGVLRIEQGVAGLVLRYNMASRALLFCFLAPLLFLGIAQLTVKLGELEKPTVDASNKSGKGAHGAKKPVREDTALPQNPIDKALGAPAPEKDAGNKPQGRNKKASPTSAYVFAAIFATLYVVGRILEDRLIRTQFRKRLLSEEWSCEVL